MPRHHPARRCRQSSPRGPRGPPGPRSCQPAVEQEQRVSDREPGRQGVAGELGTHVTAALDDRFEGFLAVQIHAEDPSGNFLATSGGQQVIPAAALTRQPGRRRCFNASHLPSMNSLKRSSTYQRRALRMGRGDHGPPRRSGKTRETHRAASRCGGGTSTGEPEGLRPVHFLRGSPPTIP